MKKYKFDYGTKTKQVISYLLSGLINYSFCILVGIVAFMCFMFVNSATDGNKMISYVFAIVGGVSFGASIIFFIISLFATKEVLVNDYYIQVKKYRINPEFVFRGINEKIYFSTIYSCQLYVGKRIPLYRGFRDYAVYYFNWNSLVEIKDNQGRKYYVPVQNPEEFVEEVNKRMQEAKASKLSD